MIPTSVNGPGSSQTASTAITGIASLVLEGRALSDDEFIISSTTPHFHQHQKPGDNRLSAAYQTTTTSQSNFANSSTSAIYHQNFGCVSNTNDPTLLHMQRLRQKLGQLRQTSPGTSRGEQLSTEQAISIGLDNKCTRGGGGGGGDADNDSDEVEEFMPTSASYLPRRSMSTDSNKLLNTLQSLATTCLRTAGPRSSSNKVHSESSETYFENPGLVGNSGGFGYDGVLNNFAKSSSSCSSSSSSCSGFGTGRIKTPPTRNCEKIAIPKQGPHCDQFLRKVGLTKVDATIDIEEHICDMANLNEICYHWQLHCRQIDFIMSTMDPICIEVYLGPENHEILLEQWIIQQKEKSTTPNMTLQSLANAIRSQLYFSQITAWADSLKNAKPYDREFFEHARIKFIENGTIRKPRLDIFYRIKAYDSTACFNTKPNVHDFPNVVISENCSISVCLKSLPRIPSGIPKIEDNPNNASCSNMSSSHNHSDSNSSSSCIASLAAVVVAAAAAAAAGGSAGTASCDSSDGSADQSNSSIDESMILDDRLNLPCQEKGKHRCAFDDEYGSSDAAAENMSNAELTHREKQLLKYRKRMMKRDKKTKTNQNSVKPIHQVNEPKHERQRSMQFDEKPSFSQDNQLDLANHHHQQQQQQQQQQQTISEFGSINSYRPPLYQTQHTSIAEAVQTNFVEMVSIGTQTLNSFAAIMPSCECCGNEMQLVCMKCDNKSQQNTESNSNSKVGLLSITPSYRSTPDSNKSNSNGTSKLAKGDILLQAIVRTPQHKLYDARNNNNNNLSSSKTMSKTKINDCQLCKRQKTQHHYRSNQNETKLLSSSHRQQHGSNNSSSNSNKSDGYYEPAQLAISVDSVDMHMSSDCACADEYSENCCIKSNTNGFHPVKQTTTVTADFKLSDNIDAQFKTPKSAASSAQGSPRSLHKPSPLYINCSEKLIPSSTKSIPKINLFSMFSNSNSPTPTSSVPIPIASSSTDLATFTFDNVHNNGHGSGPDIPVQKSNSAPTLPNSPSLSPRFLKQAAIYRRRARHLSDRSSERSSIGSDEQLSDEDLESLYSPTSSPTKTRMFLKSSGFGRRPLVGSFEECLLQKRFVPKSQVAGFKVLLGASGSFCPTQLTIPAVASFYELSNESSVSTPYVCEIRLPRKGYTVPRVGTVQVTLLNPLGTVVRMFVVPYDFRDMPAMSQTFIRQRILAVDPADGGKAVMENRKGAAKLMENNSSGLGNGDMSYGEQMRSLRYAIHLRFQTTRSNRLALHTDIRLLISRRTDCDTAAAHAKGALESPNELRIITIKPEHPKYSARQENPNKI